MCLEQDSINGRRYNITIAIMEEEEEEEDDDDNNEDEPQNEEVNKNNSSKVIEDSVASAIMQAMQAKQNP